MAFDLVRSTGVPARVNRQLNALECEAIVAANKANSIAFVTSAAAMSAANMIRTGRALAGGDPAVQMAVDSITMAGLSGLETIVSRFAYRVS